MSISSDEQDRRDFATWFLRDRPDATFQQFTCNADAWLFFDRYPSSKRYELYKAFGGKHGLSECTV